MIPRISNVSKVKYKREINTIPIDNKINIVDLGATDIFFKDKVGTLLTNNNAIKIVKYGDTIAKLIFKLISVSSNAKGMSINNPPAGDGTPSKKLFFQDSSVLIFVKLNLANLKTQHTE